MEYYSALAKRRRDEKQQPASVALASSLSDTARRKSPRLLNGAKLELDTQPSSPYENNDVTKQIATNTDRRMKRKLPEDAIEVMMTKSSCKSPRLLLAEPSLESSDSETDVEEQPTQYIIGTRLTKEFFIEEQDGNQLFYGYITKFNSKNRTYSVLYDDGDKEDIPEVEMKMLVSKVSSKPSNLAKNIYPIGTHMSKVFYIDEQKCNELCYGEIIRYNVSKNLYSVLYDDGDEDDISEAEMKVFVNNATRKQPNKTNSAPRIFCSYKGCSNQEKNKGVCIRHGATKRKLCNYKGCTNIAVSFGVCNRHGAPRSKKKNDCTYEGCTKWAQRRGLCNKHGGGKKNSCKHKGCNRWAQKRGLCRIHDDNV